MSSGLTLSHRCVTWLMPYAADTRCPGYGCILITVLSFDYIKNLIKQALPFCLWFHPLLLVKQSVMFTVIIKDLKSKSKK